MNVTLWKSGTPLEPGFERLWSDTLERSPYAHFGFRLDYLQWHHRLGTPALAVHVDHAGVRGTIVARLERGEWVSGLPWRWMAAVECEARPPHDLISAHECEQLFQALVYAAGGRRVRAFLPGSPPARVPGFIAGKTLLHRIDVGDDELVRAMDKTKRSMIRRAEREGYRVVQASEIEQFRAFSEVQRETNRRHGQTPLDRAEDLPPPGERWREWELPWMRLFIAEREGGVGSGFGFALGAGDVIESRAAASSAAALRSGAFVLLTYDVARRARELGCRYLNWGGDTFYKRDVSGSLGTRVVLHCWLGGDSRWGIANHSEVLGYRVRNSASGIAQRLRSLVRRSA